MKPLHICYTPASRCISRMTVFNTKYISLNSVGKKKRKGLDSVLMAGYKLIGKSWCGVRGEIRDELL